MKKKLITRIIIAIYLFALVGLYFLSKMYVDEKSDRLYYKAINNIEKFFSNQPKFVNIGYSGEKVAYKSISIPKFTTTYNINAKKVALEWEETYGDIYKLYTLKPKYTSNLIWESDNQWTGWLFQIIEKYSDDGFYEYQVFPYQVGYKKQNEAWLYSYIPSVQSAIDESFEFWTENEKSSYLNYLCKNGGVSSYDVKRAVENEYYFLFSYDEVVEINGKVYADSLINFTDWRNYGIYNFSFTEAEKQYSGDFGYMHNGYYKVYNKIVPLKYWNVLYRYNTDPKTEDRKSFMIWGFIIFTVFFLGYVIPLIVIESKRKKLNNETLHERLIRLCNPQNFMKPYSKEKVEKANIIYTQLTSTDIQDLETLKKLRKQAISDLGLEFIDKGKMIELASRCNPKNFMNPYNAEKVEISNELFSRISSGNLDIDEFEEIEEKIEKLNS